MRILPLIACLSLVGVLLALPQPARADPVEFSSPNCSRYVGVDAVILVCWFQVAGQDCSVGQATYILPLPPHVQLYGGCSPLTDWVYGPFLDWVVCVATSYYYCGPPPIGP